MYDELFLYEGLCYHIDGDEDTGDVFSPVIEPEYSIELYVPSHDQCWLSEYEENGYTQHDFFDLPEQLLTEYTRDLGFSFLHLSEGDHGIHPSHIYIVPEFPPPYQGYQPQKSWYIGTYGISGATVVPTANRLYLIPIAISYALTVDQIGVYVDTSAGDHCKLAIMTFERGSPAIVKVATDNIALGSTGYQYESINCFLSPGHYILAFVTDSSTVVLRKANMVYPIIANPNASDTSETTHLYKAHTFADDIEDNPTGLSYSTGDVPRITMRVKA